MGISQIHLIVIIVDVTLVLIWTIGIVPIIFLLVLHYARRQNTLIMSLIMPAQWA